MYVLLNSKITSEIVRHTKLSTKARTCMKKLAIHRPALRQMNIRIRVFPTIPKTIRKPRIAYIGPSSFALLLFSSSKIASVSRVVFIMAGNSSRSVLGTCFPNSGKNLWTHLYHCNISQSHVLDECRRVYHLSINAGIVCWPWTSVLFHRPSFI